MRSTSDFICPLQSIEPLDGSNYLLWSMKMKLLLMDMDLWKFVESGDGKYSWSPFRIDGENHEMWRERVWKGSEALNTLCGAISKAQLDSVKGLWNSGKELWNILAFRNGGVVMEDGIHLRGYLENGGLKKDDGMERVA